jgi:DNA mismatch repair protein MutS
MGDFYEMFWDDARTAARVLGLALTSRSKGADAIPMAGVPFHAVDGYLRKMIAAGHKVAICEQTEDAAQAKGLVKRDVVRLMTPGTLTDDPLLDGRSDNYLAAVAPGRRGYRGLAWVELSTGACWAMSGTPGQVLEEISRLRPAEVLVPELAGGQEHESPSASLRRRGISAVTARPGWQFTAHHARRPCAGNGRRPPRPGSDLPTTIRPSSPRRRS